MFNTLICEYLHYIKKKQRFKKHLIIKSLSLKFSETYLKWFMGKIT